MTWVTISSSAPSAAASLAPSSAILTPGCRATSRSIAATDQAPDRDRLADRPDPVPLRVDEDDQVLDQAIEPVRLDADVLGQCAPAVSLELALRQQLGAAIDRRHRRAQLVRQDVEERLAIALVDQPALRRRRRRDRIPGSWVCLAGAAGTRAVGSGGIMSEWSRLRGVTQAHRRPTWHYACVART